MSTIVKECFVHTVDLGPGREKAIDGYTATLRIKDGKYPLSLSQLAELFNEAAKDFPDLHAQRARFVNDHLEINEKPQAPGYKEKKGRHMTRDQLETLLRSK